MYSGNNYSVFSKTLLFITALVYALNYAMDDAIYNFAHLNPVLVINNLELWRILTFPFAPGSIEGVMLFVITFYFISPKLEKLFQKVLYPILLGLLVFILGLVLTLIFRNDTYAISGFEGVSIYVLTLFALMKPKTRITVFNFPTVAANTFCFSTIFIWASLKTLDVFTNYQLAAAPTIAISIFGFITGLLTFIRITQIDKKQRKELEDNYPKQDTSNAEELSVALFSEAKQLKYKHSNSFDEYNDVPLFMTADPEINEQQLNSILDKISQNGENSLTNNEMKFLKEYSKSI